MKKVFLFAGCFTQRLPVTTTFEIEAIEKKIIIILFS